MRLTAFSFAGSTGLSLLNWRFCFGDLFMSFPDIWLPRISLPVPVTLNFFFAPECVFCFGISLDSRILRWAEHHGHVPPFEERLRLDQADLLHVIREAHEQIAPAIRVLALAAPEHDRDLDLRALVQEALDVASFGLVVVNPDLGSELDLLDVDLRLVLAGQLGLLLQLVSVLAVVHDSADRRISLGRDLDQVEVPRVRVFTRFVSRLDPELLAVLVDEPHARNAYCIVDARLRLWTARRFETTPAPRPQMLFTKLVLTSSSNKKPLTCSGRRVSQPASVEQSIQPPKRELGGERRFRPCLPDTQGSNSRLEISQRECALAPTVLPDRKRVVGLLVAVHAHERDLPELGVPDALGDSLVGLVDLDPVRPQARRQLGRRRPVALAHRDDADLDRRQPERERPGPVLDQEPDQALERAVERAVDDEDRVLLVVRTHVGEAEARRHLAVELDRPELP